jgi:hypothetical protein
VLRTFCFAGGMISYEMPLWLAVSGAGATPAVVVLLLSLFSLVVVKFLAMLATTCAVFRAAKEGRNMKTLVFASIMETIHAVGASNWASGPLAKVASMCLLCDRGFAGPMQEQNP